MSVIHVAAGLPPGHRESACACTPVIHQSGDNALVIHRTAAPELMSFLSSVPKETSHARKDPDALAECDHEPRHRFPIDCSFYRLCAGCPHLESRHAVTATGGRPRRCFYPTGISFGEENCPCTGFRFAQTIQA